MAGSENWTILWKLPGMKEGRIFKSMNIMSFLVLYGFLKRKGKIYCSCFLHLVGHLTKCNPIRDLLAFLGEVICFGAPGTFVHSELWEGVPKLGY